MISASGSCCAMPKKTSSTAVSLANIGRALSGGVNDSQFPRWLDENLFDGATFDAFHEGRRPRVWINASDIYNRTPFIFGPVAFDALCSDIRSYKIADAVAASAAVPLAFAPIVLETFPGGCATRMPDWIERARHNPDAQPLLRSFAEATARYHDGSMKYVKLLDGGLVDNFGLSGFSIGMLAAQRPYDPMTERQAVRVRRMMFLVVDAGRGLSGNWANSLEGPNGTELVAAAADTAIDASVRSSYAAFSALVAEWTGEGASLALRAVGSRPRQARAGCRLEMRRPQYLHGPRELRAAGTGARRDPRGGRHQAYVAGRAGGHADRKRRRRAAPQRPVPSVRSRPLRAAPCNAHPTRL